MASKLKRKRKKKSKQTAGDRMITSIPIINQDKTIKDAKDLLFCNKFETVNYFYVVNGKGKLAGIFSIKRIFCEPEDKPIKDIMIKKIVKVKKDEYQEEVAHLALKHNLKSIPVVDEKDKLLGIISSDVILDILHKEMSEDILHSVGIHGVEGKAFLELREASAPKMTRLRLPWLLVGLLGGVFAARLLYIFNDVLSEYVILALFIPVMVYMAGAVAVQSETLFIRRLIFEHDLSVIKYLLREIKVGFLLAIVCSFIISLFTYFWWQEPVFGLIIGLSMFCAVFFAIFVAIFIPWLLTKLKFDPALGSGPFATIIQDIISLVIYFLIATNLIKIFL